MKLLLSLVDLVDMKWKFKEEPNKEEVFALAKALQIPQSNASLLVQRKITTYDQAKAFFRPQLSDLHDPFLMLDMDIAVARIRQAISSHEPVMVFGDYDVDGTTAVSLVTHFLEAQQLKPIPYIPDRYEEGYGLSFKGIDHAATMGITLIIALDCGIKAITQVAYAKDNGIEIIICDHHKPGTHLPEALAILNPKRIDCSYPFKDLCGCGVGFKLIQALSFHQHLPINELLPYLDLVVTAIAADIVSITGENRILAYYGLQVLNESPRAGLKALMYSIKRKKLNITDVVFVIAPRINAAGRIKHGGYAVELLLSKNLTEAELKAKEIEGFNIKRRELDQNITEQALEQIITNEEQENASTVVFDACWHKGVIGIVASRLMETYYRPTLVFTKSGEVLAASARSVKGFDLYKALEACQAHILQFGGHQYAAGLTLRLDQYDGFKKAFEAEVRHTMPEHLKTRSVLIDQQLDLKEITPKFFRIIKQMAPFGPGNMRPVFMAKQVVDSGYSKNVGTDDSHLKASLKQANSKVFGAIGFGLGTQLSMLKAQTVDIAFDLEENEWNNQVNIQLRLKDIK